MARCTPLHTKRLSATRKILAAIEAPARSLIESLENRLLMTVAMDPNGWTQVTPTPGVSRQIYVSSSTGSDSNNGLSPSSPVATLSHAVSMLRPNSPDWLLLNRGDTFNGTINLSTSGISAQQPVVITNYGDPTLPRPVVDAGANNALTTGTSNHYVDIIGITFTTSTHNPASPNFTNQASNGISDGGTTDVLVEDCKFSFFIDDLVFQTVSSQVANITVRRNEILDSYSTTSHSEGLYAEEVNNLTIQDNVFDHDGWNTSVAGGGATGYNHDAYLHQSDNGVVVTNNIFADAGSVGLQARSGGIIDDNLFVNDPYGFTFGLVNGSTTRPGGVSGEAIGNVVIEPRVDTVNTWGTAIQIGNLKVGGGTVIANNIVAGASTNSPAIIFAPGNGDANPQQEAGLNSLLFTNNTVYNWGNGLYFSNLYVPGGVGADGLTNVVVSNNDIQNTIGYGGGRAVANANLYDPRYEDFSGNTYASSSAASNWFQYQSINTSFATWKANIEPTAISATVPFVNPTPTVESYMGSLGLTATMAGYIAGARNQSFTNWNPVYFASAMISYVKAGFTVVTADTIAPTAAATPPPDVTLLNYLTTPTPTFTITYSDNVALNPATIAGANIGVTGVGGLTLPVSLMGTSGSGNSITATYQVSAPLGDWTTVPNGTFVISLAGGQVSDTSGNSISAEPLGAFQVTVNADPNPPVAAATTPASLAAVAGTSLTNPSISLSWSDPAGDQRSYVLERALDANFTQSVQNFPMTADATSYTDSAVSVGVTYYYELIAINPIGPSLPTAAANATVVPPGPALSKVELNDGNTSRTAITSVTLVFTTPVTVDPTMVSLVQNPQTNPTPVVSLVSNPSGDGKTWILSWSNNVYRNALPDGSYSLTVHGGLILDAFGQAAGGDHVTNFASTNAPVVTAVVYNHLAPPHSLAYTFSEDVSASLASSPLTALTLLNSAGTSIPAASYSWNAATLTATWTYSGALPDGNYRAQLSAARVTDSVGVHLDGNGDAIPGDDNVFNFTQVKPTATASGNANVNSNAPYTLTLGAITDAGETSPQYLVHWGDGSTTTYSASGKVTHTYSSAVGATTITVDVLDANGTHAGVASVSLSVNKPTITLSGSANANPGATYTLTLGTVTDPGFTVSQYVVHWGDGQKSTYTSTGAKTHVYSNGTTAGIAASITVDLVDNGGSGGASFTNLAAASRSLTINPSPTVTLSAPANANAGGIYSLVIGKPTDPGFTVSQLVVHWGDGSPATAVPAGTTLVTHTYNTATAPGTDSITVDLTDNSGTYTAAGQESVTVNSAPTVALSGSATAGALGTYVLTVSPAVDPGQTVSTYTINWGDGSPATVSTAAGNFNHIYALPGKATITVDVADGTGVYPAAGSMPITIVNTGPTLVIRGSSTANVGGRYLLLVGTVIDPGQTVSQVTINWGDGTSYAYTSGLLLTHTYAATGPATISVDVTDGTGTHAAIATLGVNIGQPSVNLSGNSAVFQGQNYALTINPSNDPGAVPLEYVINWGDGTNSIYAFTGPLSTISATHVFSTAQDVTVTADMVDNTGTYTSAGSLPLTIAAPPTVNLAGSTNTNAGGLYTLTLAGATDPIGTISSFIVHWGDNTTSTASGLGDITHVYSATGAETITIDIVDQNGTFAGAASMPLTVNQPTLTLAGNSLTSPGQPWTLTTSNVNDPGQTVALLTVNWGDGSAATFSGTGDFQHTYTTPGTMDVTVDLTDGIGTYLAAAKMSVVVAGPPTLALSGNANANAGGSYALTLGSVTDANGTPSQYLVHWGDGNSDTYTSLGTATHTYATPGTANISVDVTDPASTWASAATSSVTINSAPTIALAGSASANAGGTYTLSLGALTDPGYSASQYLVHWGDGNSTPYAAGAAMTHVYATPGPATITVDLTDASGTFASAGSRTITVNPAPTIAVTGSATANAGGTYTLSLGALTDPGYSASQYLVHWGDGNSTRYAAGAAMTHVYAKPGPATITVDLTDATGTFASAGSHAITVNPAPTIALSGASSVTAGVASSLTLGAVSDPGYAVTKYTIHWGDGSTTTSTAAGVVTHTFTAAQSAAITVDLTDATGTYASAGSLKLTVNASAPGIFTNSIDIGSPALTGSASQLNGTYTLTGEGNDIWNASDQFHYNYKNVTGNTTITAKVTGVQNTSSWAKAGVMVRNGTAANAAFADVVVTPAGYLSFQYRSKAGGTCSMVTLTGKTVQSVRLTRSGNTFTAWYTSNGTTWIQIGKSVNITMNASVCTGLAVCSNNVSKLCTATFSNVSVV
jgi:hypothetical protein